MKKIVVLFLAFQLLSTVALAGIELFDLHNQLVTFAEVVELRGRVDQPQIIKVNGNEIVFRARDGAFKCGLVLQPGKNLVQVTAVDEAGRSSKIERQILKLTTFDDLEIFYAGKRHWAREQIVYLSTLGFIEGYPDNNYYPSQPVSRGEFATWLARVRGLPIAEKIEADVFYDVPREHWRAPYIKAAYEAGLVLPLQNDFFGLEEPITRREVAQMALKIEELESSEDLKPFFVDVLREEEGAQPIYMAGRRGLIRGVFEDIPVFDPDRSLTRAEAAVLLARFSKSLVGVQRLFDFSRDYSPNNFCRVNIPPQINSLIIEPERARSQEKKTIIITASFAERKGFYGLAKVKVDLSEIGGPVEAEMKDDGEQGDLVAGDLNYTLSIVLPLNEPGSKLITVTAIDQLGWEEQKQAYLRID
ncbi:MAG: S-layer homology domain-containing protein [bacterium]